MNHLSESPTLSEYGRREKETRNLSRISSCFEILAANIDAYDILSFVHTRAGYCRCTIRGVQIDKALNFSLGLFTNDMAVI